MNKHTFSCWFIYAHFSHNLIALHGIQEHMKINKCSDSLDENSIWLFTYVCVYYINIIYVFTYILSTSIILLRLVSTHFSMYLKAAFIIVSWRLSYISRGSVMDISASVSKVTAKTLQKNIQIYIYEITL